MEGPAAAFQGGVCPTITFAKANRESKKGEDFAAAVMEGDSAPAAFAIFDGHSGKETARICSETVVQRLLQQGPPFTPKQISDMLWAVDEEIGTQKIRDGATAQILLIEKNGDQLKGTFAWCGDSSAVLTNVEEGTVKYATASHTAGPDHQGGGAWQSEKGILEFYGAVRKQIESTLGIDTQKDEVSADMVEAAIQKLGKEVKAVDVDLLVKAYRRGRIIAQTTPDGAHYRKQVFVRQRDIDHDANQVWVVSTAESRADPGYSDLQMTRSVCDWRASDMVLPNPECYSFNVPAGQVWRVCLASDGLWDVCSFENAAETMKKHASVDKCAKDLLRIAEKEYLEVRGHEKMDDDTTVLVIELNPSGIKSPIASAAGCCDIM